MMKYAMAAAVWILAALPSSAAAQESEKYDCVVTAVPAGTRGMIGAAMAGEGEEASRDALFKELAKITDACVARHGIADGQKGDYFDYSLSRIAREALAVDIAKYNLPAEVVDRALDFGPTGTNPDLSSDMSEEQIMTIVQAYIETGVDIEKVDSAVWEKVGAYAAATSIYWSKRKSLAF